MARIFDLSGAAVSSLLSFTLFRRRTVVLTERVKGWSWGNDSRNLPSIAKPSPWQNHSLPTAHAKFLADRKSRIQTGQLHIAGGVNRELEYRFLRI